MSSPDGQEASAGAGEVVSPGLLARLMAAVRPEFRRDVLRFDAADPVFGGSACGVPGCARLARGRGLCLGHHSRWRQHGSPDLERFTATASPRFAREVLACCQAPGCRYGVVGHGLCGRHLSGWRRAGRPELAGWLAVVPPVPGPKPACPVPGCGLWAQPAWPFCRSHGRAWIYHGRPDTAGFLARFSDRGGGIPAYESIDLRGLPPHLKLEVQYALQCRRDEEAIKTPPDPVRGVVRFLQDAGLASFLDWPEETWRRRFPAANARTKVHAALAIYARRAVESLAYGHGWQVEYPRDDWRLRSLGISGPRATISFGQISQPWLRELAKRWTRWRLSAGLGPQQAGYGVLAIARLSEFLAEAGAASLADIDRPLIEHYLATVRGELAGTTSHARGIGQVSAFLDAIRRHGWDATLPATAAFYPEDFPRQGYRLPRALAEHVMAQLEDPVNLDRWDNDAYQLLTVIHLLRTHPPFRLRQPRSRRRPLPALRQHQDETGGTGSHRRGTRRADPGPAAASTATMAGRHADPVPPPKRQHPRRPRHRQPVLPGRPERLAGTLRHPRRARPAGPRDTAPVASHAGNPAENRQNCI